MHLARGFSPTPRPPRSPLTAISDTHAPVAAVLAQRSAQAFACLRAADAERTGALPIESAAAVLLTLAPTLDRAELARALRVHGEPCDYLRFLNTLLRLQQQAPTPAPVTPGGAPTRHRPAQSTAPACARPPPVRAQLSPEEARATPSSAPAAPSGNHAAKALAAAQDELSALRARCAEMEKLNGLLLAQQQPEPVERSRLRAALGVRAGVAHWRASAALSRWSHNAAMLGAASAHSAKLAEMAKVAEEQQARIRRLHEERERLEARVSAALRPDDGRPAACCVPHSTSARTDASSAPVPAVPVTPTRQSSIGAVIEGAISDIEDSTYPSPKMSIYGA